MTDLLVIVPSRGRPQAVAEMAQAFGDTCTGSTRLVFMTDDDDPDEDGYLEQVINLGISMEGKAIALRSGPNVSMVDALNRAARRVLNEDPYAIAFMGDDHRPRTKGWDTRYLDALRQLGTGIVFGNDLLQGQRLPTQVAMTADIVRALGWMAPPVLRHLYVDDFWRDLGVHAGCLRYLPDVVVEHLHPVAGKAEMDEGYARVNDARVYDADQAAYREFQASGAFRAAVEAVRALAPADPKRARHVGMARASLVAEAAYLTGGRTVVDFAAQPTDLSYLLGPALQVQHDTDEIPADIVCATERNYVPEIMGARAAVTAGMPLEHLTSAGFALLRTRCIGDYMVALGVRR